MADTGASSADAAVIQTVSIGDGPLGVSVDNNLVRCYPRVSLFPQRERGGGLQVLTDVCCWSWCACVRVHAHVRACC